MHSAFHARPRGGTIFGFPLAGFGLFTSLLLSLAVGLFVFCATTCVAIFALLAWSLDGHQGIDFAATYRDVGLPAGLVALGLALPFFGTLWIRAKLHK